MSFPGLRNAPTCLWAIGFGAALCAAPQDRPQDPPPIDRDALARVVRQAVAESFAERGLPAVLVAVVDGDEVVLTHSEGRVGGERRADASTLFPVGDASRTLGNLVLAALGKDGKLDLAQGIDAALRPFVLRTDAGAVAEGTLGDLLFGRVSLPRYSNHFPAAEASRWSTERAVLENAFVLTRSSRLRLPSTYRRGRTLAYGMLQRVAERATGASWQALVRRHVAAPHGLRDLIPDGRTGLPTTAAGLYSKGLSGARAAEEPHILSDIPASHGAWVHGADLGRLLRVLLSAAAGAESESEMTALTRTDPVFAGYTVDPDPHPHLLFRAAAPGMRGGIAIYPRFRRAFAAFTNIREGRATGMPGLVRAALEKQLFPPAQEKQSQWNPIVGGGAGGALRNELPEALHGEWKSPLRLHGREHVLHMSIDRRGPWQTRFDSERARGVLATRSADHQFLVQGLDLLPVREGAKYRCEMVLFEAAVDGRRRFDGWIEVHDDRCWMAFPVTFTRAVPRRP